jgi:hypothetical protein
LDSPKKKQENREITQYRGSWPFSSPNTARVIVSNMMGWLELDMYYAQQNKKSMNTFGHEISRLPLGRQMRGFSDLSVDLVHSLDGHNVLFHPSTNSHHCECSGASIATFCLLLTRKCVYHLLAFPSNKKETSLVTNMQN